MAYMKQKVSRADVEVFSFYLFVVYDAIKFVPYVCPVFNQATALFWARFKTYITTKGCCFSTYEPAVRCVCLLAGVFVVSYDQHFTSLGGSGDITAAAAGFESASQRHRELRSQGPSPAQPRRAFSRNVPSFLSV